MKVVLFDTETTDLIRNTGVPLERQPRIIELFAMIIEKVDNGWQRVDEYEQLFNPGIKIPQESVNITGITDEMVKDAPPIKAKINEIAEFFGEADMVVAHNLSYDMGVVGFECKRYLKGMEFPWPASKLCTVEATEHFKGHRLSLQALHQELFGEGFEGAHRARQDVEKMALCFQKLWEMGEI